MRLFRKTRVEASEAPAQTFDRLVRSLGFDSLQPDWSPALHELHRHARDRKLQILAALLANSSKWEILVGVYFLQKTDPAALVPFTPEVKGVFPGGGSLWMRARD